MSADKHRSESRRINILRRAVNGRLFFHRVGGMSMHNRDVQRLINDGHLRFERTSTLGHRLSPKRFTGNFNADYRVHDRCGGWLHGRVNYTFGVITPEGEQFLKRASK